MFNSSQTGEMSNRSPDMEEEDTSVTRNEHKVRAFSRAINVLSQIDYPIRTAAEASVVSDMICSFYVTLQIFSTTSWMESGLVSQNA